jgi:hypothetical protein
VITLIPKDIGRTFFSYREVIDQASEFFEKMKRICLACGLQSQNGTQLLENIFIPNPRENRWLLSTNPAAGHLNLSSWQIARKVQGDLVSCFGGLEVQCFIQGSESNSGLLRSCCQSKEKQHERNCNDATHGSLRDVCRGTICR